MSEFFTPPPRREPEPDYKQPPWLGPPENELGVPVPLRIQLARTDDVAVGLLDVSAFSTGLEFRMGVRLRVVLEWPSQKIALTRVELDAEPMRAAAAESEKLWPGDEPGGAGGNFVTSQRIG